jgi:hypothetical protein
LSIDDGKENLLLRDGPPKIPQQRLDQRQPEIGAVERLDRLPFVTQVFEAEDKIGTGGECLRQRKVQAGKLA